jgi:anti-anti-sigma factor
MNSSTTTTSKTYELRLEDSFDALAIVELRHSFDKLVELERDVEFNLERVTFIDSSGLGAIVFLFKRLRAINKTLTISNAHGQPLQLLQYLRVDKVIDVSVKEDADQSKGDGNE